MQVRAVAKYVRVQPRKVRIVAQEVKGKPADSSAQVLRFHKSKSAAALRKVLVSAMANALENHGVDPENLRIARIMVDEGPSMKRMMPRAMGRGNRILKKTSHITVIVEECKAQAEVKPHGTRPKSRPSFRGTQRVGAGSKDSARTTKSSKEDVGTSGETEERASHGRLLTDFFGAPTEFLDSSEQEDGIRTVFGMKFKSNHGAVVWLDANKKPVLAGEDLGEAIEVSFAVPRDSMAYDKHRQEPDATYKTWLIFSWEEEDGSECTLRDKHDCSLIMGNWRIESKDETVVFQYLLPIAQAWGQSTKTLSQTVQGLLRRG